MVSLRQLNRELARWKNHISRQQSVGLTGLLDRITEPSAASSRAPERDQRPTAARVRENELAGRASLPRKASPVDKDSSDSDQDLPYPVSGSDLLQARRRQPPPAVFAGSSAADVSIASLSAPRDPFPPTALDLADPAATSSAAPASELDRLHRLAALTASLMKE